MPVGYQKRLCVPETGSVHFFKRFLFYGPWRACDGCGKRHRKLHIRDHGTTIHWVCHNCCKRLIYRDWSKPRDLEGYTRTERLLIGALCPEL